MSTAENGLPTIQITHVEQWTQLKDNLKVFILKRAGEINFQVRNHPLGNRCIAIFNQERKEVIAMGLFGIALHVLEANTKVLNDSNMETQPWKKTRTITTTDREMLKLFVRESGFADVECWLRALTEEYLYAFPKYPERMTFQMFDLTDITKAVREKGEKMESIDAGFDNQKAIESGYYRLEHDKYPELCYAVDWREGHELVKLIATKFGNNFTVSYGHGSMEQPLEYAETTGTFDVKKRQVHLLEFPLIIEIVHELAHFYTYDKFGIYKHGEAHTKAVEEIVSLVKTHLKPPVSEIQEKRRKAVMESANRLGLVPVKK